MGTASAEAYADDTQGIAKTRRAVTQIAAVTREFARVTNQRINTDKSHAYTTQPAGRKSVNLSGGRLNGFIMRSLRVLN